MLSDRSLDALRHLAKQPECGVVTCFKRPGREAYEIGEDDRDFTSAPAAPETLKYSLPHLERTKTGLAGSAWRWIEHSFHDARYAAWPAAPGGRQGITETWVTRKSAPHPTRKSHEVGVLIGALQPLRNTLSGTRLSLLLRYRWLRCVVGHR